jgi:hypothetical protein
MQTIRRRKKEKEFRAAFSTATTTSRTWEPTLEPFRLR